MQALATRCCENVKLMERRHCSESYVTPSPTLGQKLMQSPGKWRSSQRQRAQHLPDQAEIGGGASLTIKYKLILYPLPRRSLFALDGLFSSPNLTFNLVGVGVQRTYMDFMNLNCRK